MQHQDHAARWQQLLSLGEALIAEPGVEKQHSLVTVQLGLLLKCRTRLFHNADLYQLPGLPPSSELLSEPMTDAMCRASETQQMQAIPPSRPTLLAAPLLAAETCVGVLQITRPASRPFSAADRAFFGQAAGYLASTLHLTRQVADKNWRLEQLNLMRSVSAQLGHIHDLDELCRRITHLIRDTFKYYYVAIFTLEPGQPDLHFRAAARPQGKAAPADSHAFVVSPGEGIVGSVALTGEEIIASSVQQEKRYRFIDILPETRSEFALPLRMEDRVLGVLDVQSDQPDAFHATDQLVLHSLADSIAVAVESAHLYQGLRRRAEQISTVAEIGRAITSILDLDTLLVQIVRLLYERFGYPYVHVFTVHPGRRKIIYAAGSGSRSDALAESGLSYDMDDPHGIIPWVAREGKTLLANDVSREPRYRPTELPPLDTRAELAVPFIYNDEVLGLLDVQSDRIDAFAADDLFLFETLADNVTVALRNAMLYRSEKWRRQVAESLRDVAGMLSENVALDRVLDAVLTELERNLPCAVAAIWLLGEDLPGLDRVEGQRLQLAAIRGVDPAEVDRVRQVSADADGWLNDALVREIPQIRSPGDPPGPLGLALGYAPDYSSIAVPLRAGEQVLGILALAHPTPSRYGSEARQMTAAFASYAAVAIENTRLFASAQEQAWVSTVMLQVAEATRNAGSLDELLSAVVRLAPMLVGVRAAAVFLWNEISQTHKMAAAYGLAESQRQDFDARQIAPGQAAAFDHLREIGEPIFVEDCRVDLGFGDEASCEADRFGFVLFPLATRSDYRGALLVEQRSQPTGVDPHLSFGSERLAILQGIAQQTAVAIENLYLIEGKQEDAYVTAVLLQVAQAVVSSNDLNDILDSIVHLMPILVGIDFSAIYLWDPLRERFIPTRVYSGSWREEDSSLQQEYARGEYPLLDAVARGEAQVICALTSPTPPPSSWPQLADPGESAEMDEILTSRQDLLMGFPLTVKGDLYGVLVAQESQADPTFRPRRLEIINGIAQQASLAIQNDRLNREMVERERLEREFQLAREIQRTFLPSIIPEPTGWDLDVRWRPAREVGGDFYDAFELPGRRLGLVIADVSDKGMPAALYMTVTRTLIRAGAQEESSPARVLERVNNLLLMDSQYGMFVTCVYAILSLGTGEVVYSNAGHNRPLIRRAGRHRIETLKKGGMAMAVLEDNLQADHTVHLNPGDTLFFFTDGVTEAFSADGELYEKTRLEDVVRTAPTKTAQALLDAVDASLNEFTRGAPVSDDVTLIAIRRNI